MTQTSRNLSSGRNRAEVSKPGPFLRWAGGKQRLLDSILPHVPRSFRNYYEPFLGGGAVFFAVRGRAKGTFNLSDLNEELINFWCVVRDRRGALLRAVADYTDCDTEDAYYAVRASDAPRSRIARAARFLYLNQTAWNGLWRVNRWGVFNVPWGARPFRGMTREEAAAVSSALTEVHISAVDFREALVAPRRGDFVYLDPPYLPISDTSKFSGYTERRFRRADLAELAACCRALSGRGVVWVLSNRDTPLVRELFSFARINAFTARRSVAAQNRRDVERRDSPEVVIVGRTS